MDSNRLVASSYQCAFCKSISTSMSKCSRCQDVYYCSPKHEIENWSTHRNQCFPLNIDKSGKHYTATCDLNPGEVILEEDPILQAPIYTSVDQSHPTCISCGLLISLRNFSVCSLCNLPVCGQQCAENPIHRENECKVFSGNIARSFFAPNNFALFQNSLSMSIVMLRGAGLISNTSSTASAYQHQYQELIKLPNNCSRNSNVSDDFDARNEEVVKSDLKWLKSILILPTLPYPDEVYTNILKIFRMNGFSYREAGLPVINDDLISSVNVLSVDESFKLRVNRSYTLYSKASGLKYSCVPNCTWSICPELGFKIRIRATIPINKGEELTIIPSGLERSFAGTFERQRFLNATYGIQCDCPRCKDPKELGLLSSAVTCASPSCKDRLRKNQKCGYYLPLNPLAHHHRSESIWKCRVCGDEIGQEEMQAIVDDIRMCIQNTVMKQESPLQIIEAFHFVQDLFNSKGLHPNHYLLADSTARILMHFDYLHGSECTRDLFNLHINWLKYILRLRDKMFPGLSIHRASILRQLSSVIRKKLDTIPPPIPLNEVVKDYILFMESSKAAFEFYQDDFLRPGEDFNFVATALLSSMKSVYSKWGNTVKNTKKVQRIQKLKRLDPFLSLVEKFNDPRVFRWRFMKLQGEMRPQQNPAVSSDFHLKSPREPYEDEGKFAEAFSRLVLHQ